MQRQIAVLDEHFVGAEFEVLADEVQGEAVEATVPRQHGTQFRHADEVVVVERRKLAQVRQAVPWSGAIGNRCIEVLGIG